MSFYFFSIHLHTETETTILASLGWFCRRFPTPVSWVRSVHSSHTHTHTVNAVFPGANGSACGHLTDISPSALPETGRFKALARWEKRMAGWGLEDAFFWENTHPIHPRPSKKAEQETQTGSKGILGSVSVSHFQGPSVKYSARQLNNFTVRQRFGSRAQSMEHTTMVRWSVSRYLRKGVPPHPSLTAVRENGWQIKDKCRSTRVIARGKRNNGKHVGRNLRYVYSTF